MNATTSSIQLRFTGYESDRFVRFAKRLRKSGIVPFVQVVGREPITTTNINFQGEIIREVWDGYRRILEVKTSAGIIYQVGGTNSTRPIASQTVIFFDIPHSFLGPFFGLGLDDLLAKFINKPQNSSDITDALKYNIRLNVYDDEEKKKIINTLLEFVTIEDNDIRRDITELIGLTDSPLVLEPMSLLLGDIDKNVRVEASLRFRGLEPVVKSVGESSELGEKCITALINALDDIEDEVRIYAVEDLGYFYNENAIKALVHSLAFDSHEHVRWAAAVALGRTNNEDVARYLANALEKDTSSPVQQGIMLGLGRIGSRITQPDLREKLIDNLRNKLTIGELPIQDYASYALGEVGLHNLKSVDALLSRLGPENPFQVKSNILLSLTKLISLYLDNPDTLQVIETNLRDNLGIPRPDEWPSSAYYQWFQSGAAELSALLELHELAYKYYRAASMAFAIPWLKNYYEAIGSYEYAEHLCSQNELYAAREILLKSIELFEKVEKSSDFLAESEKTKSGLQFKVILARARINLLDAIIRWEVAALREQDYTDIQKFFDQAVNQYRRIDLTGLTTNGKKLTRAEENLVLGLMLLSETGYNLIKLDLLIVNLDEQKLRLSLGSLRNQIKRMAEVATQSRSQSLKKLSKELMDFMQESYELDSRIPITEIAGNLIEHAKRAFSNSLPTPGNCPIIDFGNANMTINLRGSISGDGTQEQPFVFPSNHRVVFEITVSVLKRTKNDRLVFLALNPPSTIKDSTQEIPVYESQYTLRPIDYGLLAPGIVATQYDFVLLFQNQGCSQPIHNLSIWVRTYDFEREFITKSSRRKEKMEFLQRHIIELKKDLSDLREIGSKPGNSGENINERIRKLEINLQTKIGELDVLDREDIDFGTQLRH